MRILVAGGLAALCTVSAVHAGAQLRVVAADNETGTTIPRFAGVDQPTIADDGSVVFKMSTAPGSCAIVTWNAGNYRCVVESGAMLPGGGSLTDAIVDYPPVATTGLSLVFAGQVDGARTSIFRWQESALKLVAGFPADPPVRKLAVTNKNGESIAFEEGGKLFRVSSTGALESVYWSDIPVPGLPGYVGTIASEFPQLDDKGELTFVVNAKSTVTSDERAVVLHGAPEKLTMDQPVGAPADPWRATAVFANADGLMVYGVSVTPEDSAKKPWTALWAGLTGATEQAVRFPVTVGSGTVIESYLEGSPIAIARGGRFVFKGSFADPAFPSGFKSALVFVDRKLPSLIAAEGSPVPGMSEAKVHRIQNYAIADNGDVYAAVDFVGITDPMMSGQAIFVHGAAAADRIIVRTGDVIEFGPVNGKQRIEYAGLAQTYGAGYPRGVASNGAIAPLVAFDGATLKKAVLVSTIAGPNDKLPDLRVSLSDSGPWSAGGGRLNIKVDNLGDAAATAVQVAFSTSQAFTASLTDRGDFAKCPPLDVAAKELRCTVDSIAAGESATLVLAVQLQGDYPFGDLALRVIASPAEIDKDPSNNQATFTAKIVPPPEESGCWGCGMPGRASRSYWLGVALALWITRRRLRPARRRGADHGPQ